MSKSKKVLLPADLLEVEYVANGKSAADIAVEYGLGITTVLRYLKKVVLV